MKNFTHENFCSASTSPLPQAHKGEVFVVEPHPLDSRILLSAGQWKMRERERERESDNLSVSSRSRWPHRTVGHVVGDDDKEVPDAARGRTGDFLHL